MIAAGWHLAPLDVLFQILPDGVLISRFALPDDENPPVEGPQCLFVAPIPGDILSELPRPESDTGLGCIGVPTAVVSVPEATVDEYRQPASREDKIGATGEIFPVQPETETELVRDAANDEFRLGVPTLDPGHHLASPPAVDDVRHGERNLRQRIKLRFENGLSPRVSIHRDPQPLSWRGGLWATRILITLRSPEGRP